MRRACENLGDCNDNLGRAVVVLPDQSRHDIV
jgi:hypothetical protein